MRECFEKLLQNRRNKMTKIKKAGISGSNVYNAKMGLIF
jgi:hypothetical protein